VIALLSQVTAWAVTAIVVAVLATFVAATYSLHRLPTNRRPHTPKFDRLGRQIGLAENPDYRENPGVHGKKDAKAKGNTSQQS
jgi:hypothetical protein